MMKNKHLQPASTHTWKGYTIEEMRYAKVIALTRTEIEKAKLLDAVESARESLPFVGSSESTSSVFKSMSFIQYAVIAYKLFRRIAPLFRKKK